MNRISALAHALDRFGFDEQASACRRLASSRAQAFKADSPEWSSWANDAEDHCDDSLSPEEFESWVRNKAAALEAFDALASPPPPLLFDTLGDPLPPVANSLIKVNTLPHHTFLMNPLNPSSSRRAR